MRNLYKQLKDSSCPYQDLDEIAYELTRELEKKDQPFLIVLDDVKEISEINKFYEIPGKNFVHCTWLLTTEKHTILSEYDTRDIRIGLLRPEESTLILEYDLSQKGEFDEEKLRELVALLFKKFINFVEN